MKKCEYEVTVRDRRPEKPEYALKCTLTGHACPCPEEQDHCTRRVYALTNQAKLFDPDIEPQTP